MNIWGRGMTVIWVLVPVDDIISGLAMGKNSGISVLSISKMFSVWFGSSLPHKNQNTLQRDLCLMNYDSMKYMSKAKFWEYENMANFEAFNLSIGQFIKHKPLISDEWTHTHTKIHNKKYAQRYYKNH